MISKKILFRTILFFCFLYGFLLIPDSSQQTKTGYQGKPFIWNKDALWSKLEAKFVKAKTLNETALDSLIRSLSADAESHLARLSRPFQPNDSAISKMLTTFFEIAPLIAAQSHPNPWYLDYYRRARLRVKKESQNWNMSTHEARDALYEILYGMRAAVEEIFLQPNQTPINPITLFKDEASACPYTNVRGIRVHSGDLLVSRGGAEVSALISRGNDYPGNFSHAALMYVDEQTNEPHLIEAHIEKGVALATVDQYLGDKKLRFMVLRARADLPELLADPLLPHKAARSMYEESSRRHIPYDFKMNFYDSTAMFCSEVCSFAYKHAGIRLWQAVSTISSPGIVNWLYAFGVDNFVTQMPSDLEYDPQLSVVAEWRNPETLLKDHVDNAVMDAMLQNADKGEEIDYNIWMLPVVRTLKGYCAILNLFGAVGMIPEGMSATRALKNEYFKNKHERIKVQTINAVEEFKRKNGYIPPYWQLVKLAEEARDSK